MSDDETKAKEEAYLNDHFGGGWLGASPEAIHDYVNQPTTVTNDLNPVQSDASHDSSAAGWIEAAGTAAHIADGGLGGVYGGVELAAEGVQAVMDPHAHEVEQRLGEYGGTLPDGGLAEGSGESNH